MKPLKILIILILLSLPVQGALYKAYSNDSEYSVVQTLEITLNFKSESLIQSDEPIIVATPIHNEYAEGPFMRTDKTESDYSYEYYSDDNNTWSPFSVNAVVSGLSAGTTYWIDLTLAELVSGGEAWLDNISVSIVEL